MDPPFYKNSSVQHRQTSGYININMFTQALSFLMLSNPLYCEKEMWTGLNHASVHIYIRLELSVKIRTGETGRTLCGKTKTSTSLGSTLQIFRDIFCLY